MNTDKPTLFILRGLPCSGKTKYAKFIVESHPNAIRISKDDIRSMVFPGLPWSGSNENIVVALQSTLLAKAIEAGRSVVLDDLNLHPKHVERYRKIADENNYEVQLLEMDVSIEKCIKKDAERENPIGQHRMAQLATRRNLHDIDSEYVIYGLDDTLFDVSTRRYMAQTENGINPRVMNEPEWLYNDVIRDDVRVQLLEDFEHGFQIVLLTHRPETLRGVTEGLLQRAMIPYHALLMRPNDLFLTEVSFKQRVLRQTLPIDLCRKVYEDNPSVIKMFKDEGLTVFQCVEPSSVDCAYAS